MEKRTYYVSVGAGGILEDNESAAYEFEINGSDDDIHELQELFEAAFSVDEAQMFQTIGMWREYQEDPTEDVYDQRLQEIYRLLHRLGTEQTREHIEQMQIL